MLRYDHLRGYLALLEGEGELRRVCRPVSAVFEIAAALRRMGDCGGPALLFENVLDHDMPVVGGLFASGHRALLALGVGGHRAANAAFLRGLCHPIAPMRVAGGPCQEVVTTGEEVDLDHLPLPLDGSGSGGAAVMAGLTISGEPSGGHRGAWVHRLTRVGPRRLAFTSPARPGARGPHRPGGGAAPAAGRGHRQRRPPGAAVRLPGQLPPGVDGLATGGGILGRPVETVRCRTVDLEVPADAEIVVEGRITPGGPDPAIEVTAITHRREPLLVAGPTGPPASDDHVLEVLADESSLLERLRRAFPEVTAVCVPDWGGGARSAVVVALRQRYKGQARHLILTALGDPTHLRSVIVVDDDVDVFSTTQVNRAMTTRFQPAEDLIVLPRRAWGADATRP